ncbi:hypothetical protein J5N97_028345 [Dioscorea zingiberensis]|uniref:Glabrous enhancer-binding protein-like DBD domain-containing protein n=1 Tax=Dioscorea zingiberensis TaxID=325984 RepID=A0A9D5BYT5_9LILI|nr:hypothetical protein J5N97_028345 [Dioscorea zingiberensis]
MAPKRPPSKAPPKPPSSSSSSSDDEESEREPPPPTKNPTQSSMEDEEETSPEEKDSAPPKKQPDDSHSSSGEESDSDAEPPDKPVPSQRPSRGPDPSIKPINSKPMGETPNSNKSPTSATPKSSKSGKKPLTAPDSSEPDSGIAKRKLFERFWSVDDEIKILEGILEYHRNKGSDPASVVTSNALHSFMKSFLGSEFGKHQLGDKIQRLKSSYRRNASRAKDNGDPNFSKLHEKTKYELSKKIWGAKKASIYEANDGDVEDNNDGNGGKHEAEKRKDSVSSVKSRKRKSKLVNGILDSANNHPNKEVDDGCSYEFIREAFGQMNGDVFKGLFVDNGLKLADPKKAKKLDEEFRKLSMVEMKLKVQGMDIVKEVTNLLMEVFEKSG